MRVTAPSSLIDDSTDEQRVLSSIEVFIFSKPSRWWKVTVTEFSSMLPVKAGRAVPPIVSFSPLGALAIAIEATALCAVAAPSSTSTADLST